MSDKHSAVHRNPVGLQRASFMVLALLVGLATHTPAHADGKSATPASTQTPDPCAYAASDRLSLLDNRLASLQLKLDLQPGQTQAWKTWEQTVRTEVKKQSTEECRINMQWWTHASDDEIDLSTPERLKHQEDSLRNQLALMQAQLERLESAEKNTVPFYAVLDAKQKTIFDLFWRLEHATSFHPSGMNRPHRSGASPSHTDMPMGSSGISAHPAP